MSGLWKKIKKVRRGSRAAKMLCGRLQRWGVDARMIEEEGDCVARAKHLEARRVIENRELFREKLFT